MAFQGLANGLTSELRKAPRRELLAVIERQAERIAFLEQRVRELEVLRAKALKNSSTSSKPPSSDLVKPPKPPGPDGAGKRARGGQRGHPRHTRALFPPEAITAVHRYTQPHCPQCGHRGVRWPGNDRRVQQAEIVPRPIEVHEHWAEGYWCGRCGRLYWAPLPAAVEQGGLIGPVLTAQLAYMKGALHASFSTIQAYVRDVLGLTLSRGHLSRIIQKVSGALAEPYEALVDRLKSERVLNVDETGHKDNGDLFWTWGFRAGTFTVFRVADTRGSAVLAEVLGREFAGTLGCDFFSAYRKYMKDAPVGIQFCLAHFIREVKFLGTLPDPAVVRYGERLLEQLRALFHVIHQREALTLPAFQRRLAAARKALMRESQRAVPDGKEARLLAERLRRYGEQYFRFITTPGLAPTNNLAEQALRFVTIDRHITHGTRGERGRQWSERIWTVLATCAQQKRSAYDYLVAAVHAHFHGQPVPSLTPSPVPLPP